MSKQRLDVHHHFLPPEFVADLAARGAKWTGGPKIPEWNLDLARETMARNGIAQAVGSVVPGVYWGDIAAAVHWARHANEYMARIVQDEPSRFGAFAAMPLPDTHAACRELEYALDVLKLDGVQIMSSVGVQYPGDPDFEEFFQELDRRKAIVHIHPSTVVPGSIVPKLDIPWGVVEFVMDTTRAVANLIYSGTMERYPNIRFIVSHAGGTIPYITMRMELSAMLGVGDVPKGVEHYMKQLYFDTALSTHPATLAALTTLARPGHLLYGSDWPMMPEMTVVHENKALDASPVLDAAMSYAIERGNAEALFPRLAKAAQKAA
ncbi:amidohydrolase [Lysobacter sp. KIS68-7]|uniref:amidohydrolase family protein n=1 Tax=Lysobacter sp. KIS68-7 TaxID=2904252 RepID=UPI001E3A5A8B|nr:amidohydrolase family protein [Lysobacter sp. KIS68-7]UHQ19168.1 amidohydrolase [Lysobacter sp. KIS68-7]